MVHLASLPDRGVIEIAGDDRVSFLQGLVSNDVTLAAPDRAIWAALLTPQGKWLADFFILSDGARLLLDVERGQAAGLVQRMARFRLRAKVTLQDRSDTLHVHAAWAGTPDLPADAVAAPDPRLEAAGLRIIATSLLPANATPALGLPNGSADLESEKTVLLEAGFDELQGISWSKGCYMGQELTARTKYRGLLKRRLVPVAIDGAAPAPGTPVLHDGAEVGAMRSARGAIGLALLRLDAAAAGDLRCGETRLHPVIPAWMRLPATPA
jgi:folate-binding protein YgfZ